MIDKDAEKHRFLVAATRPEACHCTFRCIDEHLHVIAKCIDTGKIKGDSWVTHSQGKMYFWISIPGQSKTEFSFIGYGANDDELLIAANRAFQRMDADWDAYNNKES